MDKITIIQGDTYEAQLSFTGIDDFSVFDKILFSCNDLGVCKEIEFDEELNSYVLKFSPEETQNMTSGRATFDITVIYKDSNVQTPIYCNDILVKRKVNGCG